MQSVKKRAEIGVYLGLQVAGKKSETFTRLDGGACKNDALDLAMLEQAGGGGDGQIGLAGAGRAEAKGQVVVQDRVDVFSLTGGFGLDPAALEVNVDLIGVVLVVIVLDAADGVTDLFDAEPVLTAQGALELFEDGGGLGDLLRSRR